MSKALTVHNAEIQTAAVEIRTLTISGKQVTLAVFRQLREEPLIAVDGTLNGVPWGVVNYHPDKCGGDNWAEHWHVVWQRGTELLRSLVDKEPEFRRRNHGFSPESGDELFTACVWTHIAGLPVPYFQGAPIPTAPHDYMRGRLRVSADLRVRQWGISSILEMPGEAAEAAEIFVNLPKLREDAAAEEKREEEGGQHYPATHKRSALREAESALRDHLASHKASIVDTDALQVLFEAYDAEMESEAARRKRHLDLRRTIAELPQLFIAV